MGFDELSQRFAEVASEMGPDVRWRLWDTAKPKKAVILVSKEGHCLHDLLGRVAQNDYPMDVAAVIGNHEDLRPIAQAHGIPFHYVPFPKDAVGKRKAFDQVADLVNAESPDAIVLARFMQILRRICAKCGQVRQLIFTTVSCRRLWARALITRLIDAA